MSAKLIRQKNGGHGYCCAEILRSGRRPTFQTIHYSPFAAVFGSAGTSPSRFVFVPRPVRYGFMLQVLMVMFPLMLVVKLQKLVASLYQVKQFRRALICEAS